MNRLKSSAFAALSLVMPFTMAWADVPKLTSDAWPKWLGPNGTGISQEKIADKWPEGGPKKLWSAKVGKGYGSAVAVDGKVYIFALDGGKEVLSAFEADTGKPVWADAAPGGYPKDDYPGVRTTPAIEGDRIYTLGGKGTLVAHELATGKPIWSVDTLKEAGGKMLEWGQASNPLILGDQLIVQGGDGGSIALAVDKQTGKTAWKSQATGKAGYANVILVDVEGTQQLIVFGGTALYGMDPKGGKTLWQQPWKTGNDINAATPVYDGKGNLLIASASSVGAGMFKLSPTAAKKTWGPNREAQCKFQPPILEGDTLYVVSEDKRGIVKALDWKTGKVRWSLSEPKVGFGGAILRVADKLIVQAQTGELHLIKATPEKGELVSTFKPYEHEKDQIWSMPLVYQGKMYGKGSEELVCFDVK